MRLISSEKLFEPIRVIVSTDRLLRHSGAAALILYSALKNIATRKMQCYCETEIRPIKYENLWGGPSFSFVHSSIYRIISH